MRQVGFQALLIITALGLTSAAQADSERAAWMARKLLAGGSITDYELALKRFVELSDPLVLPTLLKLLDAEATPVRAEAAGVMWHYNTKDVREKLVLLKADPEAEVQIEAAKSLCLMKFVANMGVVVEHLGSKEQAHRSRSLRALAEMGGPEAIAALEKHAKVRSPQDKIWLAYARYRLGLDADKQLTILQDILLSFPKAAWLGDRPTMKDEDLERAEQLGAANMEVRLEASEALSRLGDEPALTILVRGTADRATSAEPNGAQRRLLRHGDDAAGALAKGLADDRPLVRLGAAQVAARTRLKSDASRNQIAEALGQVLDDRAALVRLAALRAVASQGLTSLADRVARMLQAPDPATRAAAALAIGKLGQERFLETLLKTLATEEEEVARRGIYRGIARLGSARAVKPMLKRLSKLHARGLSLASGDEELRQCIAAVASAGDAAAERVLALLPKQTGEKRKLLKEVLAKTGSDAGIDFFMDVLRESPPDPDSAAVRFFDSLSQRHIPRLKASIESETAMWIRVILARTLFRLGEKSYGRGLLWALKHDEEYYRKLSAALARDVRVPGSIEPLIKLLEGEPKTAWYAARALMSQGSTKAIAGLLASLSLDEGLRRRTPLPLRPFWEGQRTRHNPYAKEVDNERVWVLFTEDRIGGKFDLFLTWSQDGKTWTEPIFTGLTSFADGRGQVPPPTFSLEVRGRKVNIALTRTFATTNNPSKPLFKTLQRVTASKWQDFFKDKDGDGLKDTEEKVRFTNPGRADTDGDGLPDGRDKNPLARPAAERDDDIIKLLTFSHALLVADTIPMTSQLLVVEEVPGVRRPPELPTWPGLVLHLRPDQYLELWRNTGGGYPRIRFGRTSFQKSRSLATQLMDIFSAPGDRQRVEVSLRKRQGQWIVTGLHAVD